MVKGSPELCLASGYTQVDNGGPLHNMLQAIQEWSQALMLHES